MRCRSSLPLVTYFHGRKHVLYLLYVWVAEHHWLKGVQSDGMVIFRAAAAIMISFTTVLLFGNRVIRWLLKQKVGDRPEFHNATLNELTKHKGNTPTMGGILIIGAILLTCFLLADIRNFYVIMALFCMVYLAVVGGVDDWLKLTTARRNPGSRDGLYAYEKMLFQVGLGVILAVFIYRHPNHMLDLPTLPRATAHQLIENAHHLNWPFLPPDIQLPAWLFAILTVIVLTGTSNAVNLTDGMDGLAGGCMAIVAFAFLRLPTSPGTIAGRGSSTSIGCSTPANSPSCAAPSRARASDSSGTTAIPHKCSWATRDRCRSADSSATSRSLSGRNPCCC